MTELIFSIIFIISFGGALWILARKVPVLATLPKNRRTGLKKSRVVLSAESRLKGLWLPFSDGRVLHKALSWLKCYILKAESLIDSLLHGLRKKAKEDKLNKKK